MYLDRKGIRQQIPESPQKRARPGRARGSTGRCITV